VRACIVCKERPATGVGLCRLCGKAYDRNTRTASGDIWDVIEWAAKRARYFAQRAKPTGGTHG
jgi:hypothetical protein